MGKSKNAKRFTGRRQNPTVPFNLELSEELPTAEEVAPTVIGNIIEQLNDPSKEEKVHGFMHMTRIVSQPKAVDLLLKNDIVKVAAPLFLDESVDVQRSALGAMRNMSVYGEERVCDAMIKNDVTTPLSAVIKKFGVMYGSDQENVKRDTIALILLEAVELFSNLCENNNRALQMFNKEGVLPVLLPLLDPILNGFPLSNSVAHCLHIVSEGNVEVIKVCKETQVLSQLNNFMTASTETVDAVLFRTRIMGIILNLSEMDLSKYYDSFIQIAGEVIDTDCQPSITLAIETIDDLQTVPNNMTEIDVSQHDIDKLLTAQGECLEMLANLCCNEDEWEEMEEDGFDDSNEENIDDAGDATAGENVLSESLCLSSEIHSSFLKHDILVKIMKKTRIMEQASSLETSHLGKAILQRLEDLQARALLCLGNVVSALYESHEQPSTPIASVWAELYSLAKSYQGKKEDVIWAMTSAMRSVIQKLSEFNMEQIKTVTASDLDFLVQFGSSSSNPETQINTIRIVSTIGCVLASDPDKFSVVKTIGELLLQVCRTNDNVVVVSETLDSLFDVFKEDFTDPVAKEINLVQGLSSIHPTFKSKVSKERKNLGEHYGIVMMARDNLMPFIKYKKARKI